MLSGIDCRLVVDLDHPVDEVGTDEAELKEQSLGFLLGLPSCNYLPTVGRAVIGLNQCGDGHVVLLVELCLSCPDTLPSGSNHTHLLTIG